LFDGYVYILYVHSELGRMTMEPLFTAFISNEYKCPSEKITQAQFALNSFKVNTFKHPELLFFENIFFTSCSRKNGLLQTIVLSRSD